MGADDRVRAARLGAVGIVVSFVFSLGACGGGGSSSTPTPPPVTSCVQGGGPDTTVTGTIRYERLTLDDSGLGPSLETRLARFADVEVGLAGGGTCFAKGSTDSNGLYSLVASPPSGSQLEVRVFSRTDNDPLRRVEVHDALPPSFDLHTSTDAFAWTSPSFTAGSGAPVDFVVPYLVSASSRPSIGFGVLDVLVTCTETVRTATGIVPPILHAYTRLGNNGATGTSFYDDGIRSLTLLGGAAGNLDGSDTDYFDDPVIAHEFGHFVEFQLGASLSRGGQHSGEALEPNLAWSEGQATGFGSLCRKDARYIDSVTTSGGTQIDESVESWPQSVRGIGGEETVAEIVWDLADGTGGIPDTDGDLAAVPVGDLYGAVLSFVPGVDAPYVGLFLDRLVQRGAISSAEVTTLLQTPENQQITYPLVGDDVWPTPIALSDSSVGIVDSTVTNPCRALDATHWYRLNLAQQTSVAFGLSISPIAGSGNDLNLALLDASGAVLQRSANAGSAAEQIGPTSLAAGHYLVRVEANCSGLGNRAGYTLTVGP